MPAHITVTPIADDRTAEWRSFVAELRGSRRIQWAQSQRRRGVTREVMSLAIGEPDLAVVYIESADPERAEALLHDSDDAFDEWYRTRLDAVLASPLQTEVVFDSAPRPGPWKGLR